MPSALFDLARIDFEKPLMDLSAIRERIPQRFEMEQLSAVTQYVPDEKIIVGYKDLSDDEFWIRGHLPNNPLMPGVMMLEASAQICSIYYHLANTNPAKSFIGYAGLDKVRFRGTVKPGDRLVLVAKNIALRSRLALFESQGFVNGTLVFEAIVKGAPISLDS